MQNIITSPSIQSPLTSGYLFKKSGKKRKSIEAVITLTSLIDAFVIIVLYLVICNSPTESNVEIDDSIMLPQAQHYNQLDDSVVITYRNNQFLIDGKVIPEKNLTQEIARVSTSLFSSLKKESAIILQADENIDFHKLQPFLVASAHAGLKNVNFAVHQQE